MAFKRAERPFFGAPALDFQHFSPSRSPMTLVSIPANPVPEDVVSGTIKTPDGAELRFARWAPPAGRKGTVCVFTGAASRSRNISRPCATCATAALRWR
jgi:lysophospholipase